MVMVPNKFFKVVPCEFRDILWKFSVHRHDIHKVTPSQPDFESSSSEVKPDKQRSCGAFQFVCALLLQVIHEGPRVVVYLTRRCKIYDTEINERHGSVKCLYEGKLKWVAGNSEHAKLVKYDQHGSSFVHDQYEVACVTACEVLE